jgi:phospholipase C
MAEGRFLNTYLEQINAGASWADQGWKNVAHFFDPVTEQGLRGWPDATVEFMDYLANARTWLQQLHFPQAFFYLGAATHLVQDMCVPFHSRRLVLAGHHDYEKWVERNVEDYLVFKGGLYKESVEDPREWIIDNARSSYDWFALVESSSRKGYQAATNHLLSLTQRTTAGFFHYFLADMPRYIG